MKKMFLLLMSVVALSCSRDGSGSETDPVDPTFGTNNGKANVKVQFEKELTGGQIVTEDLTAAVVHIWDAADRSFDASKSSDIIEGYAFDTKTNTSVKARTTRMSTSGFYELLPAGRYFVYIHTGSQTSPRPKMASSSTYFEIKYKEITDVKKVFKNTIGTQPW